MSKHPIGIFDSGVGGLSIWREINFLMPNEHTIYLADSKNAPYGNRTKSEIIDLCIKNTELLLEKGCKIIVVACNTATTNAIKTLRDNYSIPFIGIEPAIKPAALNTKTKAVGILATKGTLTSELFHQTSDLYSRGIKVVEQVGEGLVDLIESGDTNSDKIKSLLQNYLEPMLKAEIDYLVLGCTHYPFLMPILLELLPNHVKIIDSGAAVARQTKAILEKHNLLNLPKVKPETKFYTNGNPEVMGKMLGEKFKVEKLDF